jgi:hypothetical protein
MSNSNNPLFIKLMSGTSEEDIVKAFTEQLNAAKAAVAEEEAKREAEKAAAARKAEAFELLLEAAILYVNEHTPIKEPISIDDINREETMKAIDTYVKTYNASKDLLRSMPKFTRPSDSEPKMIKIDSRDIDKLFNHFFN